MTPLLALLFSSALLQSPQTQQLPRACEAEINAKFNEWHFAPVSSDVEQFAKRNNENPTIISGDFDGDGRKDTAALIQLGPFAKPDRRLHIDTLRIAVCMNMASGATLYVIDKTYCGDGISLSRRGGQYYNFETDKRGVYKLDGIHAYCFEKAGATYEFDNGIFRPIIDDD